MNPNPDLSDDAIIAHLRDFIEGERFPCVGAKAALSRETITFRRYGELGSRAQAHTTAVYDDLTDYVETIDLDGPLVQSFVAIFPDALSYSEKEFEGALWRQLDQLAATDRARNVEWSSDVSSSPTSSDFSMSVAGHPFFVVGLHPASGRAARRAPFEALVFNSTLQFDRLRQDGRYDQLQAVIRDREMTFSGSLNPMLGDFGDRSEARQYSGREVSDSWACPFVGAVAPKLELGKTAEARGEE